MAALAVIVAQFVDLASKVKLPTGSRAELQRSYKHSAQIVSAQENATYQLLNEARLRPASNSYVIPHFPKVDENPVLENATILMLCRNWEIQGVLRSMRSLEDKFNHRYHYTWTFLNDVNFTDEFKEETTAMASGKTQYALIPEADWNTPDYVNQTKYEECLEDFTERGVIYGDSKSYRNMCHFNSGFFFRQELLMNYDYYFRVEPDVEYLCDFPWDPFKLMRELGKKYSFVISLYEYEDTIPTLWPTVEDFLNEYPEHQAQDSAVEYLTTHEPIGPVFVQAASNTTYNLCHFWSNFEVGDLNFFRSQRYMDYFNYLSKKGGFYYERWGDAPVHSIAAALLLNKDEVYRFEEIGYTHIPMYTWPAARSTKIHERCSFPYEAENIDVVGHSCMPRWWKYGSGKKFLREYYHEEDYL